MYNILGDGRQLLNLDGICMFFFFPFLIILFWTAESRQHKTEQSECGDSIIKHLPKCPKDIDSYRFMH